MTQIMYVKVDDPERVTNRLEHLAESLGMVREDGTGAVPLLYHDLPCAADERDPLVIPGLLSRVLSIPDQYKFTPPVKILPAQTADLSAPQAYRYHDPNGASVFLWKRLDNSLEFVFSWSALALTPAPYEPGMVEQWPGLAYYVWQPQTDPGIPQDGSELADLHENGIGSGTLVPPIPGKAH